MDSKPIVRSIVRHVSGMLLFIFFVLIITVLIAWLLFDVIPAYGAMPDRYTRTPTVVITTSPEPDPTITITETPLPSLTFTLLPSLTPTLPDKPSGTPTMTSTITRIPETPYPSQTTTTTMDPPVTKKLPTPTPSLLPPSGIGMGQLLVWTLVLIGIIIAVRIIRKVVV